MSYIIKDTDAFINAKLTDYGRERLASGKLTFDYFAIGDSEMDYQSLNTDFDLKNTNILRPKDDNIDIRYPIFPTSIATEPFVAIGTLTPIKQFISNAANERGFFSGTTVIKSELLKQPDVVASLSAFTGTNTLSVLQAPSYGANLYEPAVGDLVLIKYRHPNSLISETQLTIEANNPVPYLWYKIQSLTGTLAGNNLVLTLDRETADFSSFVTSDTCDIYVFPGAGSILNFYGSGTTTPYWNTLTLSFDNTCDLSVDDVDVWNMNIPFTEGIAGLDPASFIDFNYFGSSGYCGTKEFIDDTSSIPEQKSVAFIHYTNNTISNVYGEKFEDCTQALSLPTIMWHKMPFSGSSTANSIGLYLSADTVEQTILSSDNPNSILRYYDMVDFTEERNVVGKVFPDYKIFAIEDEELVMAMSYKSNRNWTIPQLYANADTTTGNSLFDSFNDFYITYLIGSISGYSAGIHCAYYTKLTKSSSNPVKASCYFDSANESTFPYLTDGSTGLGFQVTNMYLIFQKTLTGERPDPAGWKIKDVTYLIGDGSTEVAASVLDNTTFEITYDDYASASTYNYNNFISSPTLVQPDLLNFGDEEFFFGDVNTEIAASSFRTAFIFNLPINEYNDSLNPTWEDSGRNVHITEMGIYDSTKRLVAIGKVSNPIEKHSAKTVVIELSIDF